MTPIANSNDPSLGPSGQRALSSRFGLRPTDEENRPRGHLPPESSGGTSRKKLQNYAQFGLMAVTLGYYETLMACSGSSTSSELNEEDQALAGISPGLVRMSVGYSGTIEQRWVNHEPCLWFAGRISLTLDADTL
nr:methionine gamma-lyase-like [Tanacetum cinerariifolium]